MHRTSGRPRIVVSADGTGTVSQAGGLLLVQTLRLTGLDRGLSAALGRWRAPRAVHDPGKIIADLAVALSMGGDCLADVAMLRSQPQLFGPVASDPVVSRLIAALAADAPRALKVIRAARAAAREHAWELAGDAAPGAGGGLVTVDLGATIVTAYSDKEQAAATWKKTWGFHPLASFADHGTDGSGEPLAIMLRPGNAGSNTAADHIEATRLALAQLPARLRHRVLIRTDSGGGTHEFLAWLARPGRHLAYSVGFTITDDLQEAILQLPDRIWEPAYDAEGQIRPGAWVAEITGMLDLSSWPEGMRLIVRKERPHPGARLRFTDPGGHRFTCFRHQHQDRAARRPGTTPPPPGPLRGPHPLRQGHGPAQPAPARLRPEPDLVRDRRPGQRTARLDADARAHRSRAPLGTPATAAAPALSRRAHRPRRAPPSAAPRRDLALGTADRHRDHPPSGPHARQTSSNHPCNPEGKHPGPVEPRRPARQPDHHPDQRAEKQPGQHPRSPSEDHERFRLEIGRAVFARSDYSPRGGQASSPAAPTGFSEIVVCGLWP